MRSGLTSVRTQSSVIVVNTSGKYHCTVVNKFNISVKSCTPHCKQDCIADSMGASCYQDSIDVYPVTGIWVSCDMKMNKITMTHNYPGGSV